MACANRPPYGSQRGQTLRFTNNLTLIMLETKSDVYQFSIIIFFASKSLLLVDRVIVSIGDFNGDFNGDFISVTLDYAG